MGSFSTIQTQLLARVAELGGRYGLNPGDYAVSIGRKPRPTGAIELDSHPTSQVVMAFSSWPTDPARAARFRLMLATIGVPAETGERLGDHFQLLDALDRAIRVRDALDHTERSLQSM